MIQSFCFHTSQLLNFGRKKYYFWVCVFFFASLKQIQNDLSDPDTSYGLLSRIVGVESAITLVQQFGQIRDYLDHLLLPNDNKFLTTFFDETLINLQELRKPIYMCVAAKVNDLDGILASMAKVKWDINHVNVEHSTYVNNINRVSVVYCVYFWTCELPFILLILYINLLNCLRLFLLQGLQIFAMRLEEIEKTLPVPKQPIWDCVAHVITHTLVEG